MKVSVVTVAEITAEEIATIAERIQEQLRRWQWEDSRPLGFNNPEEAARYYQARYERPDKTP